MTVDRILPVGGLGPPAGTDTTTAGGRGMSAPERIWAFDYDLQEDDGTWRNWQCWSPDHPAPIIATEYIRADLLTAAQAEIARLTAELEREEKSHAETIGQRDRTEAMADELARAIGGDAVGEHSNINCPWTNALGIAREMNDEITRLRANHSRFSEAMAAVEAAKAMPPPKPRG